MDWMKLLLLLKAIIDALTASKAKFSAAGCPDHAACCQACLTDALAIAARCAEQLQNDNCPCPDEIKAALASVAK